MKPWAVPNQLLGGASGYAARHPSRLTVGRLIGMCSYHELRLLQTVSVYLQIYEW